MKVTLPNGATLEGTEYQVKAIARSLGFFVEDGLHYNSSTHGVMLISKMDDRHIRNAIRKIYREWTTNLDTEVDNATFVSTLTTGLSNNDTMVGLVAELQRRARK